MKVAPAVDDADNFHGVQRTFVRVGPRLVENEISPRNQHARVRPDIGASWSQARMIAQTLDPRGDEAKNAGRRPRIISRDCKPDVFEIVFRRGGDKDSRHPGPDPLSRLRAAARMRLLLKGRAGPLAFPSSHNSRRRLISSR